MGPRQKTEAVLTGLDILLEDRHFLHKLRHIPPDAVDENVLVQAVKLQTAQTDFLTRAVSWLRQNYLTRTSSIAAGLDHVDDAKATLQKARDALRMSITDDLYLTVKWRMIESQERKKLEVVCPHNRHLVHLSKQRDLHDDRIPDTGRSIVEDVAYRDWRDGDLPIIWCSGLGGAGKTYAASAVIDGLEFHAGDYGLAYFFCEFNRRQEQDDRSILAALTRQLLARKPALCSDLPRNGEILSIKELQQLFVKVVRSFDATFIIIDALDEFSEDVSRRYRLAEMLVVLQKQIGPKRCRICITSRPAKSIFDVLINAKEIEVRVSEAEIGQYIENAFELDPHAKSMARQDPGHVADAITLISKKSDRM